MYFTSHANTNTALVYILFLILDWQFGVVCLLFSWLMGMAPDLDVLLEIRRHYQVDAYNHHRFLTHKPLFWYALMVVASGLNMYFHLFGWEYMLIAFSGITSHFVMDGIGEAKGEGIEWLWPFTNRKFGPWLVAKIDGQPIKPGQWYGYYFHNPYFLSWEAAGFVVLAVIIWGLI